MLSILEKREKLTKDEIPDAIKSLKALLEDSLDDIEDGLDNLDVIKDKEHEPTLKRFLEDIKMKLDSFKQSLNKRKPTAMALDAFDVECSEIVTAIKKQYQEIIVSGLNEKPKQFILKILTMIQAKIDRQLVISKEPEASISPEQQQAIAALFENALNEIKKVMNGYSPSCFVSYALGVKEHEEFVHQLGNQLITAGIDITLDVLHNYKVGAHIPDFIPEINRCTYAIVVGTPKLMEKYSGIGSVVKTELDLLADKHRKMPGKVIKLQLDGEINRVFPEWLGGETRVHLDCRQSANYYERAIQLLDKLYENSESRQGIALKAICDEFKQQKSLILKNQVSEDLLSDFVKAKAKNQAKSEAELLTKIRTVLSISGQTKEKADKQVQNIISSIAGENNSPK